MLLLRVDIHYSWSSQIMRQDIKCKQQESDFELVLIDLEVKSSSNE